MSSYLMCSLNQYLLRTHCVPNLMLGTVVAGATWGSAQPLSDSLCRAEVCHEPMDTVIPVAKGQPGGMQAQSRLRAPLW